MVPAFTTFETVVSPPPVLPNPFNRCTFGGSNLGGHEVGHAVDLAGPFAALWDEKTMAHSEAVIFHIHGIPNLVMTNNDANWRSKMFLVIYGIIWLNIH